MIILPGEPSTANFCISYLNRDRTFKSIFLQSENEDISKKIPLNTLDKYLGLLVKVMEKIAIVHLQYNITKKQYVNTYYSLQISNIDSGYITSLEEYFKQSDIVVAKIISVSRQSLTLKDSDLGLLISQCPHCKICLTRDLLANKICQNCNLTAGNKKFSKQNFEEVVRLL